MAIKTYQIKGAFESLQRFEAVRQKRRSYWSPMIYTKARSKKIIDECNDKDLRAAGVDVEEARRLAVEVR